MVFAGDCEDAFDNILLDRLLINSRLADKRVMTGLKDFILFILTLCLIPIVFLSVFRYSFLISDSLTFRISDGWSFSDAFLLMHYRNLGLSRYRVRSAERLQQRNKSAKELKNCGGVEQQWDY